MAGTGEARVRELLAPVVADAGYDLEGVAVTTAGRRSVVRVVVDRDGGIDLDAVADLSRVVSDALDHSDVLGDAPYVLEVTSPGVDRPLTEPRHWRRNIGRLVRTDTVTGRVVDATDEGVVFDVSGEQRLVGFGDLGVGHVEVEFRRDEAAS
jgi:ribosome maturation factor RimP